MTQQQVVSKEAKVESTSSTESSSTEPRRGDYTKYFYRNIDNLWAKIGTLQQQIDNMESTHRRFIQAIEVKP